VERKCRDKADSCVRCTNTDDSKIRILHFSRIGKAVGTTSDFDHLPAVSELVERGGMDPESKCLLSL
jgi:hypothetical protein